MPHQGPHLIQYSAFGFLYDSTSFSVLRSGSRLSPPNNVHLPPLTRYLCPNTKHAWPVCCKYAGYFALYPLYIHQNLSLGINIGLPGPSGQYWAFLINALAIEPLSVLPKNSFLFPQHLIDSIRRFDTNHTHLPYQHLLYFLFCCIGLCQSQVICNCT